MNTFKIAIVENKKNHEGNFFFGNVNINGVDLEFSTAKEAQFFIDENAEFFQEFKAVLITLSK